MGYGLGGSKRWLVLALLFLLALSPAGFAANPEEREVKLDQDAWRSWNKFFTTFSEVLLPPFAKGRLNPETVINFGVHHNYWYNRKAFEALDQSGLHYRIPAAIVAATGERYFGQTITDHHSTSEAVTYRDGYYYLVVNRDSLFEFTQLVKLIDNGGGYYTAELNVYSCDGSSCFAGDPNGTAADWNRLGAVPALARKIKAVVQEIGTGEERRYILIEYLKINS